jgi:hypothetical protein
MKKLSYLIIILTYIYVILYYFKEVKFIMKYLTIFIFVLKIYKSIREFKLLYILDVVFLINLLIIIHSTIYPEPLLFLIIFNFVYGIHTFSLLTKKFNLDSQNSIIDFIFHFGPVLYCYTLRWFPNTRLEKSVVSETGRDYFQIYPAILYCAILICLHQTIYFEIVFLRKFKYLNNSFKQITKGYSWYFDYLNGFILLFLDYDIDLKSFFYSMFMILSTIFGSFFSILFIFDRFFSNILLFFLILVILTKTVYFNFFSSTIKNDKKIN